MFDTLSRIETELFEVEETIHKNVSNTKDINLYVEQKFVENGVTTTKFVLDSVPFKLSTANKLIQNQNITTKYAHYTGGEAPRHGISSVLSN